MEEVRISKYFTDCGIMSRRACEAEIINGQIKVNGEVAVLGQKVKPGIDTVTYKGKTIKPNNIGTVCIMLNKPRGVVSTASDEKGRTNVTEFCKDVIDGNGKPLRLYPVGRLDMDSEGLILLTNDGELANKLTHPSHSISKVYHVTVSPTVSNETLQLLEKPIRIDGKMTSPAKVSKLDEDEKYNASLLRFEIHEGRNRQIRRICERAELKVKQLVRVSEGTLNLGDLIPGKWRYLSDSEISKLKNSL